MDATVCATCQSMLSIINGDAPAWKAGNIFTDSGWNKVPEFRRLCYFNFSDVSSAALAGCPLCLHLQTWSLKYDNQSRYKGLDFSVQPNVSPGAWKLCFGVSNGDGHMMPINAASRQLTFTCHPLGPVSLNPAFDLAKCYKGFGIADDSRVSTGSNKSIEQIQYWLRNCLRNHATCGSDQDSDVYPPRLLDLRNFKVALLSDTSSIRGTPYVALSHSWGPNPQQLTLTTENQSTISRGIESESLPPTFCDAIDITRALGIDYLWIDSLCIIQAGVEHVQDWLGHSTIMGSIYQNCILNIAAAHGHDAQAGCFVRRNPIAIGPCIIQLHKITVLENSESATPRIQRSSMARPHLLVPEPLLTENLGQFHLDTRGWVCQERLLSPRTIYFSQSQLFWECSEAHNVCESIPEGIANSLLPAPDKFPYLGPATGVGFSWGTMQFDEKIPPYSWRAPNPKEQYEWWLKTLHGYVRRDLTKRADRLPAIGGIAKRTAAMLNDKYLAGMFESRLPDALLWSSTHLHRPKNPRSAETSFAPSWSWASSPGNLDFTPPVDSNSRFLCTVTGSHLRPVDPSNLFGQIHSASLTLRGPLLSFPRTLLDDPQTWCFQFAQLKLSGLASKKQLCYFDFDPCTLACATLSLLVLRENARQTTYPGSGNMEEAGLILAPGGADAENLWMRAGVFKGIEYSVGDRKKEYSCIAEVTIV